METLSKTRLPGGHQHIMHRFKWAPLALIYALTKSMYEQYAPCAGCDRHTEIKYHPFSRQSSATSRPSDTFNGCSTALRSQLCSVVTIQYLMIIQLYQLRIYMGIPATSSQAYAKTLRYGLSFRRRKKPDLATSNGFRSKTPNWAKDVRQRPYKLGSVSANAMITTYQTSGLGKPDLAFHDGNRSKTLNPVSCARNSTKGWYSAYSPITMM